MRLCRNFLLRGQHFAADGAMCARSFARRGARCGDFRVDDLGVSLRGNDFLLHDNGLADGAVPSLGQAGCRAGRCNGRIDYFGMPRHRYRLLLYKNSFANGTVLSLRQTRCGTGRRDGRVNDLRMSLRGNDLLRYENGFADSAVLAFGQARFRTGCCDGRVGDLRMPLRRDGFLLYNNSIANGAMLALSQTRLGTGCLNCRVDDLSVSRCPDGRVGIGRTADRTGVGRVAVLGAGRRGDNRLITVRRLFQRLVPLGAAELARKEPNALFAARAFAERNAIVPRVLAGAQDGELRRGRSDAGRFRVARVGIQTHQIVHARRQPRCVERIRPVVVLAGQRLKAGDPLPGGIIQCDR